MRNAFAEELVKLSIDDKRIVFLSGDIGNRLFNGFKKECPDRFFNCGVAEANMTGMAAGMALCGLKPITYSITPFNTIRCLEQIRVDVCYHNLPVVIVGVGGGLSYAELGATHHSCDDIGILRTLPNISIVCPCDPLEVKLALSKAVEKESPVYIRLGKKGEPSIHNEVPDFVIGRSITVRSGKDTCILSTGNVMSLSLAVSDELSAKGLSARVESFHTVKPLDLDLLNEISTSYKTIVTIEEHSLIGGLGSAVAEWMSDNELLSSCRLLRFGTGDYFLSSLGKQPYARDQYGLTSELITEKIIRQFDQ